MKKIILGIALGCCASFVHAENATESSSGWGCRSWESGGSDYTLPSSGSDYVLPFEGAKAYAAAPSNAMLKDFWAHRPELPEGADNLRGVMQTIADQISTFQNPEAFSTMRENWLSGALPESASLNDLMSLYQRLMAERTNELLTQSPPDAEGIAPSEWLDKGVIVTERFPKAFQDVAEAMQEKVREAEQGC